MGSFRRFIYIMFVLIAVLTVLPLAFQYFGIIWNPFSFIPDLYYYIGLGILALGLLVILVRALFAHSVKSSLRIKTDVGEIFIAQRALESCVRSVVESNGKFMCTSAEVDVKNARGGNPTLNARAEAVPTTGVNLNEEGRRLQHTIGATLNAMTGCKVESIVIDFGESDNPIAPPAIKDDFIEPVMNKVVAPEVKPVEPPVVQAEPATAQVKLEPEEKSETVPEPKKDDAKGEEVQ